MKSLMLLKVISVLPRNWKSDWIVRYSKPPLNVWLPRVQVRRVVDRDRPRIEHRTRRRRRRRGANQQAAARDAGVAARVDRCRGERAGQRDADRVVVGLVAERGGVGLRAVVADLELVDEVGAGHRLVVEDQVLRALLRAHAPRRDRAIRRVDVAVAEQVAHVERLAIAEAMIDAERQRVLVLFGGARYRATPGRPAHWRWLRGAREARQGAAPPPACARDSGRRRCRPVRRPGCGGWSRRSARLP